MEAYITNTNVLTLTGLTNSVSGAAINNATVTVTIKDGAGSTLAGASGLTMDYVAASNGTYRATLPDTLPFVETAYCAHITVDGGPNQKAAFQYLFRARPRTI